MLNAISASKWNQRTAAHLLNRAGFGGTLSDVRRLVELGPERAISWFVDYEKVPDATPAPDWAKPDPNRAQQLLAFRRADSEQRKEMRQEEQRTQREHMLELRQWWVSRMVS